VQLCIFLQDQVTDKLKHGAEQFGKDFIGKLNANAQVVVSKFDDMKNDTINTVGKIGTELGKMGNKIEQGAKEVISGTFGWLVG